MKPHPLVVKEYADMLSSLMLCSHFNPNDDKALRKSLKLIRRRLKTPEIKHMCQVVIRTRATTPTQWLHQKESEIGTDNAINAFLLSARTRVQ